MKEPEKPSKSSKFKKSGQSTINMSINTAKSLSNTSTATARASKSGEMNKKAKKVMDPKQSNIDQFLTGKGLYTTKQKI